jgi:hypothetical protein
MATSFSSSGGRLARARARQIDQAPPKFTGPYRNAKTRGPFKPLRLTMTSGKSAARRSRSSA